MNYLLFINSEFRCNEIKYVSDMDFTSLRSSLSLLLISLEIELIFCSCLCIFKLKFWEKITYRWEMVHTSYSVYFSNVPTYRYLYIIATPYFLAFVVILSVHKIVLLELICRTLNISFQFLIENKLLYAQYK